MATNHEVGSSNLSGRATLPASFRIVSPARMAGYGLAVTVDLAVASERIGMRTPIG